MAHSLLSICRASRDWLYPVAYNTITLNHPRMMLRFAKTVSASLVLGSYVRSLWVGPDSIKGVPLFVPTDERCSCSFAKALHRILTSCTSLIHLALIHCPLVSIPQWSLIERSLPPRLQTLAMGPDHAMLGPPSPSTSTYTSLRHLISIETTLVHVELANITSFPSLQTLEWCFLPDSGTMKLECSESGKFGEKLGALLLSPSLKHVKIVRMHDGDEEDWPMDGAATSSMDVDNVDTTNDSMDMDMGEWRIGMGFPRTPQCMVVPNTQGNPVKLEFKRRSCVNGRRSPYLSSPSYAHHALRPPQVHPAGDTYTNIATKQGPPAHSPLAMVSAETNAGGGDWISQLFNNEWKKSVVTRYPSLDAE